MKIFENINNWLEYQQTPWAQLRYELSRYILEKNIPNESVKVLDAGGGNGQETLWLAE